MGENTARGPHEILLEAAYVPAFLKQCAERGMEFSSDDELGTALQSVAMLKLVEARGVQAAQNDDAAFHKAANAVLRSTLTGGVSREDAIADDTMRYVDVAAANEAASALIAGRG